MSSIRQIRRRIKSTQNIAQITKAMEMVAASKMKKAQDIALAGKFYAEKIYQTVKELASKTDKKAHPLFLTPEEGITLVIIVSTNKGLCGGLNTNLLRMVEIWFPRNEKTEFITVGKKGEHFVVKTGRTLTADFSLNTPFTVSVPSLTSLFVKGFLEGKYKEVYIVYNDFVNPLKQLPEKKRILPLAGFQTEQVEKVEETHNLSSEFLIEPSPDDVLDALIPHYLENQLRTAIYEGEASEHSARMIAMKNATDASGDLMSELTLLYNKARQERITYEISDMVTARLAVE